MKPHTSSTLHLLMSSAGFAVADSSPSVKRPPMEPARAAEDENDVSIHTHTHTESPKLLFNQKVPLLFHDS